MSPAPPTQGPGGPSEGVARGASGHAQGQPRPPTEVPAGREAQDNLKVKGLDSKEKRDKGGDTE